MRTVPAVLLMILAGMALASVPEPGASPTAVREMSRVYPQMRLIFIDVDDPDLTMVVDGKAEPIIDPKLAVQRPGDLRVSLMFRQLAKGKVGFQKPFPIEVIYSGSLREFGWPGQIGFLPHILPQPTPEELAEGERFGDRHQLRIGAEVDEDTDTVRLRIRYRLRDVDDADKVEVYRSTVTLRSKQTVMLRLPFKAVEMYPPDLRAKGDWDDCEAFLLICPHIILARSEN